MSALGIGTYQLRNLLLNQTKFAYICIQDQKLVVDEKLQIWLNACHLLKSEDLNSYLSEKNYSLEFPIVLVAEDENLARKTADFMSEKKYSNVYYVRGGLGALREEEFSESGSGG